MKRVLFIILICFYLLVILTGCSKKDEPEIIVEEPKKFTCSQTFEGSDAGYDFIIDFEDEHVIFIEDHYWDLKGWSYNKKKYISDYNKEAAKLNALEGVTVSFTGDSKTKEYSTHTELNVSTFDYEAYSKIAVYFKNPYIKDKLENWFNSTDPKYHETKLKDDLSSAFNMVCD